MSFLSVCVGGAMPLTIVITLQMSCIVHEDMEVQSFYERKKADSLGDTLATCTSYSLPNVMSMRYVL